MGLADIFVETLESENVRKNIGNNGLRVFKSSFEEESKDSNGNFLGWLWNGANKLIGFLTGEASKLLSWSLSSLWGWFTSTLQYIWNFNWNISDKSIDEQIQAKWDAIGSQLGGTLGNLVGYLGCGVFPAATIFAFNEPLGAQVLATVSEEMAEEFLGNISGLVRLAFVSGTQSLILWGFKNVRKLIKSNSALVSKIFGENTEKMVKAWGEKDSKPWSFAMATEEAIEKIPNTFIRNFVEEFLEEAWEGCVEAGYVVANSIDSYMAAEKLKQSKMPILGDTKYLEITPNREIPEEKIVLAGPRETLKATVVQTLANHQLMLEKDIGNVYNVDLDKLGNKRKGRPKINLYFLQSTKDLQPGQKKQLSGLISFRLMKFDSQTITTEYLANIATKIRQKFGNPPFIWRKGKDLYTYSDWDLGYQFQLLVRDESEARRIIEFTLDLQAHSPNWDLMNKISAVTPGRYPDIADKVTILGTRETLPTRRRNADVTFRYAQCEINGKSKPVTLYDRTGRWPNPLVKDK